MNRAHEARLKKQFKVDFEPSIGWRDQDDLDRAFEAWKKGHCGFCGGPCKLPTNPEAHYVSSSSYGY